jgi:ribosomal protein S18 acetylase RimI-like enzyme
VTDALFARLERFYDAVPRPSARAEDFGPLVLFVRDGGGYPFYARPALDSPAAEITVADIHAVRARQRELEAPEAFEWVHETTPGLLPVAEAAGLRGLRAPLMVLDAAPPPLAEPATRSGVRVRLLDPQAPAFAADLAQRRAVAALGFAAGGTAVGAAGTADRDAAVVPVSVGDLASELAAHLDGRAASALAESTVDGVLASGMFQRVDDIAEIVGVATLPAARRRGYAAAVTAVLARHALDSGVETVFLSAGSDEIARMYARLGFRRIGTACIAEPARP